jgi:hypothetical protein
MLASMNSDVLSKKKGKYINLYLLFCMGLKIDSLGGFFFHSRTVNLDTIKVFIYQLMHNRVASKEY